MAHLGRLDGRARELGSGPGTPEMGGLVFERRGLRIAQARDVRRVHRRGARARGAQRTLLAQALDEVFLVDAAELEDEERVLGHLLGEQRRDADRVLAPSVLFLARAGQHELFAVGREDAQTQRGEHVVDRRGQLARKQLGGEAGLLAQRPDRPRRVVGREVRQRQPGDVGPRTPALDRRLGLAAGVIDAPGLPATGVFEALLELITVGRLLDQPPHALLGPGLGPALAPLEADPAADALGVDRELLLGPGWRRPGRRAGGARIGGVRVGCARVRCARRLFCAGCVGRARCPGRSSPRIRTDGRTRTSRSTLGARLGLGLGLGLGLRLGLGQRRLIGRRLRSRAVARRRVGSVRLAQRACLRPSSVIIRGPRRRRSSESEALAGRRPASTAARESLGRIKARPRSRRPAASGSRAAAWYRAR